MWSTIGKKMKRKVKMMFCKLLKVHQHLSSTCSSKCFAIISQPIDSLFPCSWYIIENLFHW